jgi:ABC-type transport system substrate-binding protein
MKINKFRSKYILLILIFLLFSLKGVDAQVFDPVNHSNQYIVELADLSFNSLDPASNHELLSSGLNQLICETLFDYKGNSLNELSFGLADSPPIWSPDGKSLNISIRKGVKFHDGVEFNAWVYKYSIDRAMIISDPHGKSSLLKSLAGGELINSLSDINSTEAYDYLSKGALRVLGDYDIQINLDYIYTPILFVLITQVGCAVSPKSIIDNIPATFEPDDSNNMTGMIDLQKWFPELDGNFTKLGLNETLNSQYSGVIPSGIIKEGSPAQHTWFIDHQIGTGPWILKNKNNTIIQLDRNPNWWNANAYLAKAPIEIIIRSVPDANLRLEDLTTGNADNVFINPEFEKDFFNSDGSSKKETLKTFGLNSLTTTFLGFNQRNGSELTEGLIDKYETSSKIWDNDTALFNSGFMSYQHLKKNATVSNPFTLFKFRQAFTFAIDYNFYLQNITNSYSTDISGYRMEGLIPDGLLGHQDDLIDKGYIREYDIEVAKVLFEELGWKGTITLVPGCSSNSFRGIAFIIKNIIESLNVGINIVVKEQICSAMSIPEKYSTLLEFVEEKIEFADPDNFISTSLFGPNGKYTTLLNYNNSELNPLILEAVAETDPAIRNTLYGNLERYLAEEGIFAYLGQKAIIKHIWYQWNRIEESGSLNPMKYFPMVHFMEKIPQAVVKISTIKITSLESIIHEGNEAFGIVFTLIWVLLILVIVVVILIIQLMKNFKLKTRKSKSIDFFKKDMRSNDKKKVIIETNKNKTIKNDSNILLLPKMCLNCSQNVSEDDMFCNSCGERIINY